MSKELIDVVAATKYPLDAFLFVQRGLDFTVRRVHGKNPKSRRSTGRHVSGRELCFGIRDYAIKQYGLLARTVLRNWHINQSEDFGHIVFALVDAGIMHKTDEDSIEDFTNVYDFAEAFTPNLQLAENA